MRQGISLMSGGEFERLMVVLPLALTVNIDSARFGVISVDDNHRDGEVKNLLSLLIGRNKQDGNQLLHSANVLCCVEGTKAPWTPNRLQIFLLLR